MENNTKLNNFSHCSSNNQPGFIDNDLSLEKNIQYINSNQVQNEVVKNITQWEELNLLEDILKGIYAKGFTFPSDIQKLALPQILHSSNNFVIQAKNGSGKTATFALTILTKTKYFLNQPQTLCLCHTREIAQQNLDVIQELGKFTSIKTWLVVPQCTIYDAINGVHVIFGTPGKVRDFILKRSFPTQHLSLFIMDEADVMMDNLSSITAQVNEIQRLIPKQVQILLFSATFSLRVQNYVKIHVPKAIVLAEVSPRDLTLNTISQYYILCDDHPQKFILLSNLYSNLIIGQSIIFVNSRKVAFKLAEKMKNEGHAVSLICGSHGSGAENLDVEMREKIMTEFRNGETKVLISTDLLSRGIDVPQVTLVINYDLPIQRMNMSIDFDTYLHRIGRTGRFGRKGVAISFVSKNESFLIQAIETYFSCSIQQLDLSSDVIEKALQSLI